MRLRFGRELHYGARFYDPAVGRWWVTDPADEYHTTYAYVANNPISFVDPTGEQTWKSTVNGVTTVYMKVEVQGKWNGNEITQETANQMANYTMAKLNNSAPSNVKYKIFITAGFTDRKRTHKVSFTEEVARSNIKQRFMGGKILPSTGTISSADDIDVVAHEFMHLFGASDKYKDLYQLSDGTTKLFSPNETKPEGATIIRSVANPGFETDMMSDHTNTGASTVSHQETLDNTIGN